MLTDLTKKDIKRKQIASSCCNIFTNDDFHNISISQIAKTAGIGKGTIYEYFENKEDIVFELMSCLQENYDKKLQENIENSHTLQDKILALFNIFIDDDKHIKIQREIYKQFLIICLTNPSTKIKLYNSDIREKYIAILTNIITNQVVSIRIYDTIVGFFVASNSLDKYDLTTTIKTFIKDELKNLQEKK